MGNGIMLSAENVSKRFGGVQALDKVRFELRTGEVGAMTASFISLKAGTDPAEAARVLIAHYALARPEHPMSKVLEQGLETPGQPTRRGGRAARISSGR